MTGADVLALVLVAALVGAVVGAGLTLAAIRTLDARATRYLDQCAADRVATAWASQRKPTPREDC
ncbi:MAG: hypothetical protein ACRDZO_17090 [Egibacteraceae bacterium]